MILVNGRGVDFTNFPDGTSSFRFGLEAGICNISWKYDNDAECMRLLYLVKHLRTMGITDLYLNMPYIPNARMDRVKNGDEVFTLKWFADFINSLDFRLVHVLDPHSNVATALINNVRVMDVKHYIDYPIQLMVSHNMNPLLCYPDEGAAKRYGNAKELLRMVDLFTFFKNGTMKKIPKEKLTPELEPVIAQYATDTTKSGALAKNYTFTDLPGLLRHIESMVRDMHIPDFDLKSKMQIQLENLGYIDLTTNKKEDQRKLIVMDIYPLKSKANGNVWAYALQVRSIGTGKTNRWTIYSELYDRKPLKRFDTIQVPADGWGRRRGYLYLYQYDYVI